MIACLCLWDCPQGVGPATIFDKSFLQSLTLDEAVWFDQHYIPVITPLFFVETLADLEKENIRSERTPEDEVRIIADKFPEMNPAVNVHHASLCEGELRGDQSHYDGRPVLAGGRRAISDGKKGIVFEVSPETEAFNRWRRGEFREVDRLFARGWRNALATSSTPPGEDFLQWEKKGLEDCKTREQVHAFSRAVIREKRQKPYNRMKFVFDVLGLRRELSQLAERYERHGAPALHEYCPYTAHVLEVEVFFRFAQERGIISRDRASNRVDIAYLNYLPFCSVFVSNDRLHKHNVPLFLKEKQVFVDGTDLKADLRRINERNLALPKEVQESGIFSFAAKPPTDGKFLTSDLWDKLMSPTWREPQHALKMTPEKRREIVERMKAMKAAATDHPSTETFSVDEADSLQIVRHVRKMRGSWYQLAKNFDDKPKRIPPEANPS